MLMPEITLNGERRTLPLACTVSQLLETVGLERRPVAVEIDGEVVPAARHAEHRLQGGEAVEIVTLVGGGSGVPEDKPLLVGPFTFRSRLITGTGKYAGYD